MVVLFSTLSFYKNNNNNNEKYKNVAKKDINTVSSFPILPAPLILNSILN